MSTLRSVARSWKDLNCNTETEISEHRRAARNGTNREATSHISSTPQAGGNLVSNTNSNSILSGSRGPALPQTSSSRMASLQELQKLLRQKDDRIWEMQRLLDEKDAKIEQLKSQLHKYQSILPQTGAPFSGGRRKQRAQGISAEPQSHLSYQELSKQVFRKYSKSPRSVISKPVFISLFYFRFIFHYCQPIASYCVP